MTKTSHKKAIKALPALRASLIWFKRETVRALKRSAATASSDRIRAHYATKAAKVGRTELADLRVAYQLERVGEIKAAPRFELSRAVPSITWLSA